MSISRPITCLNTSYKLMTSVLSEILMKHMMAYYLLPVEQRALWRGQRGCLDALLLDAAIANEAQDQKRTLFVAWVDYRKAFDLVPNKWLDNMLESINAPKPVQDTVRRIIPLWRSSMQLHGESGTAKVPITCKWGLY